MSVAEYWTTVARRDLDEDDLGRLVIADVASWLHPDSRALAGAERAARRGLDLLGWLARRALETGKFPHALRPEDPAAISLDRLDRAQPGATAVFTSPYGDGADSPFERSVKIPLAIWAPDLLAPRTASDILNKLSADFLSSWQSLPLRQGKPAKSPRVSIRSSTKPSELLLIFSAIACAWV